MEENKYLNSFVDLQVRLENLLFEIDKGDSDSIHESYLTFLDNFLVLVDQIIKGYPEGKIDDKELTVQMSEKQDLIMSALNLIVSHQKSGDWGAVARTIKERLEKELNDWKETVRVFFP